MCFLYVLVLRLYYSVFVKTIFKQFSGKPILPWDFDNQNISIFTTIVRVTNKVLLTYNFEWKPSLRTPDLIKRMRILDKHFVSVRSPSKALSS